VRALVLGGYGVFGSLVAGALAGRGHAVTVAGRDGARARARAALLGPAHSALALDARDGGALRAALATHDVLSCCAGPFTPDGTRLLLEACLDAGRHYADIAEDRASLAVARAMGPRFAARGLAALIGCSSLPGVSAALALQARGRGPAEAPHFARVTLFIGNDNAKGEAAAASFLRQMGRPIAAPQGPLRALRNCARVEFPAPIGARVASDFDGPEHDVLPQLLGVAAVETKVAFELPGTNRMLALAAALGLRAGGTSARWLVKLGNLTRGWGTSGGGVMAELAWADGTRRLSALVSARDGQRLAALPCALAIDALAARPGSAGAFLPHETLGVDGLLRGLEAEGFALIEG
jgi:hypothetical protein